MEEDENASFSFTYRIVICVQQRRICPILYQISHHLCLAILRGNQQGGTQLLIPCIKVRTLTNQIMQHR